MNCGPTIVTERINELMKFQGIKNASAMAKDICVNPSTVRSWMLGKTEPNPFNILKLACYLDSSVEYITGQNDNFKAPEIQSSDRYVGKSIMTNFYIGCSNLSIKERELSDNFYIKMYMKEDMSAYMLVTDGKIRHQLPND